MGADGPGRGGHVAYNGIDPSFDLREVPGGLLPIEVIGGSILLCRFEEIPADRFDDSLGRPASARPDNDYSSRVGAPTVGD